MLCYLDQENTDYYVSPSLQGLRLQIQIFEHAFLLVPSHKSQNGFKFMYLRLFAEEKLALKKKHDWDSRDFLPYTDPAQTLFYTIQYKRRILQPFLGRRLFPPQDLDEQASIYNLCRISRYKKYMTVTQSHSFSSNFLLPLKYTKTSLCPQIARLQLPREERGRHNGIQRLEEVSLHILAWKNLTELLLLLSNLEFLILQYFQPHILR